MSDENTSENEQVDIEAVNTEVETLETNESSVDVEDDIVAKAKEMGWRPKEEFTGSEHDWKGPGAFVKDAELFSSLKKQAKEIEELQTTLRDVKQFMTKAEENGYQRAKQELKAKQREAIEMFDAESLEEANNALIELETKVSTRTNTTQEVVQKSQAEITFETRNQDWYNDNTPANASMKREAILLSSSIAQSQPELTAEEHIQVLETKIRKLYPERFKNVNRSAPSPVDTNTKGKSTTNKDEVDTSKVSPEMIEVAKRFVRQGVFKSVNEYLTYAKKSGVI